jgi:hypothetical protein
LANTYLVLEPELVVAMDLSDALQAADPEATVHVAVDMQQAMVLLGPIKRLTLAILHVSPLLFQGSDLEQALVACCIPVIFTGPLAEAEMGANASPVLPYPFSDLSLAAVLGRIGILNPALE